ncbi:MAG: carbohydrate kinase [Firmicutes bacterium]|nr:carbohydrate kinase [Bacillota bacterium]
MYDIVAIGELLIDFTPSEDGSLIPNPGGAPCNYLAAASKCGAKTAFIGKVGDDAFGRMLREVMKQQRVDVSGLVMDERYFTTLAFVHIAPDGDRSFSFARKPGADMMLEASEIDMSVVTGTRVLHYCGSLSLTDDPCRSAVKAVVLEAQKAGCIVSFDPNLREPLWKDLADAKRELLWGVSHADIVKLSEKELEFLGFSEPEDLIRECGAKLVLLTMGPAGAYLCTENASCRVFAPPVEAIDTTGAGDIFGGCAMVEFLAMDKPIEKLDEFDLMSIGSFACAMASYSTEKKGGIPSIPDPRII